MSTFEDTLVTAPDGFLTTYGEMREHAASIAVKNIHEEVALAREHPDLVAGAAIGLANAVCYLLDQLEDIHNVIEERDTHIDRLKGELASAIGED